MGCHFTFRLFIDYVSDFLVVDIALALILLSLHIVVERGDNSLDSDETKGLKFHPKSSFLFHCKNELDSQNESNG